MITRNCSHNIESNVAAHIPLGHNVCAVVDKKDFIALSHFLWFEHDGYACRNLTIAEKAKGLQYRRKMQNHLLKPKCGYTIDHINGNGLDNRRQNLRYATWHQQMCNRGPFNGRVYKGVYLAKNCRQNTKLAKRWEAQIRVRGKLHQIGTFASMEEAALAYNRAAMQYFGSFARLNIITSAEPERCAASSAP